LYILPKGEFLMSVCATCGTSLDGSPQFCPTCGSPASPKPEQRQARPVTSRTGRILFAVLLVFGLAFFVAYIIPSTHPVIGDQPVVAEAADYGPIPVGMVTVPYKLDGDDFVFSLDSLKQHRLIRFDYTGGKTPRSVMAYVGTDGRLVTAISLSEHCGSTEFTIQDNQIHCARCPSRWDMMTMEAYACCGQYYPDPIPSRVTGNEVRVSRSVVEEWAGRL
jgi:hypothetical protein